MKGDEGMRKIKCFLSIGFPNAIETDEIEVDDDATSEQIQEEVYQAMIEYVDIYWEEATKKD